MNTLLQNIAILFTILLGTFMFVVATRDLFFINTTSLPKQNKHEKEQYLFSSVDNYIPLNSEMFDLLSHNYHLIYLPYFRRKILNIDRFWKKSFNLNTTVNITQKDNVLNLNIAFNQVTIQLITQDKSILMSMNMDSIAKYFNYSLPSFGRHFQSQDNDKEVLMLMLSGGASGKVTRLIHPQLNSDALTQWASAQIPSRYSDLDKMLYVTWLCNNAINRTVDPEQKEYLYKQYRYFLADLFFKNKNLII